MSTERSSFSHVFPIIDAMVEVACSESSEAGEGIKCRAGCDHCCHLFIEVSWEEAGCLADWLQKQPRERQGDFIERVLESAQAAREVIGRHEEADFLKEPFSGEADTPDIVFDEYFYQANNPCPFLSAGRCQAYEARPTACRLHLVSSDPNLCSSDIGEDDEYEIPERIEELQEETAPVITAMEKDGRWGHFSIVLEAVLKERGMLNDSSKESNPDVLVNSLNAA